MNQSETTNGRARIAAGEVDAIVREVIARLGGAASPCQTKQGATPRGAMAVPKHTVLSHRLITLAVIEGQLDGTESIVVPRGAVITPAARDYLRDHKITIGYEARHWASHTKISGPSRLALGVAETRFEPATLIARLGRLAVTVDQVARIGLIGVVDELTERVRLGGERGLLLTGEPEAALCLANRVTGVRAAAARCHLGVRQARRAVGLNLLVIDPTGVSQHQLERAIREFCEGESICPGKYAQRLG